MLKKLDKQKAKHIVNFMSERITNLDNPHNTGNLADLWRYRVGSYHIITEIQNTTICILILQVGHHKDVYK